MLRPILVVLICGLFGFAGSAFADPQSTNIPESFRPHLIHHIQKQASSEYAVEGQKVASAGAGFQANNVSHQLALGFGAQGVEVRPANDPAWQMNMKLSGIGYGKDIQPVASGAMTTRGNRVEYRHDQLTEWYLNGPLGLEQGFTLNRPPANKSQAGGLVLAITLSGDLQAVPNANGREIQFRTAQDKTALRFRDLYVFDTTGRKLASRFISTKTGYGFRVDDTSAVYPLTIDPLLITEQAKLTASDDVAPFTGEFGVSVAVDGDTAVVGAPRDDAGGSDSGSAYVFVRSESSWTEEAKLTASDAAADDFFGSSVAVSGDTVVVGAFGNDDAGTDSGSAYVFVRSGSSWSQQQKLTASDGAAGDRFGGSVAVSGDTVVVGAFRDDDAGDNSGSAYVFVGSGSSWTEEAKLTASDGAAGDGFGDSVAISGDTAVVGARNDDVAGLRSGSAYVFAGSGSSWTEEAKLTASDGAAGDRFGDSVAISGDTAVVGARLDDGAGTDSGSAYVFVRSGTTWSQQKKLTASDAAAEDLFGWSVAVSGNTVVVGAFSDDDRGFGSGSAYVFVRSGSSWSQQQKLTASDGAVGDSFGVSVAVDGDTAVVGAHLDDDAGLRSGSAYVFVRSGSSWTEEAKLIAIDAAIITGEFGFSVAVSGDTAVVGSWHDDDVGPRSGSAYVFVRSESSWTEEAKLAASDAAAEDLFGASVAVDGDTVVIGAFGNDDAGTDSGSAYVFVRSGTTWSQQQKLTASDAAAEDLFGASVAVSGDTVVVGAFGNDDAGTDSGSAYVFVRSGSSWSQQQKLTASDGAVGDSFGVSVAVDGDTVVVGAKGDDDAGGSSGSAYVFVRSGTNWTEQAKLTASDAAADDFFGSSVAVSGDTVVVGAFGNDDAGPSSGSAYVFVRSKSSWSQQQKLTASDAAQGNSFGGSVAIDGDTVVVGAFGNDDAGTNSGLAYVFVRSGTSWSEGAKLIASDADVFDRFGNSVAFSGDTAVVGAPSDDDRISDSGSAYVFEFKLLSLIQGKLSGTMFCDDGSGGAEKQKFKDTATVTVDTLLFPVVSANVELESLADPFNLTGMALIRSKKKGVLQLFGDDGGLRELAMSGTIKINKKTQEWVSIKGKFQFQDNGDPVCTLAGKFKAK
jgi:FG-GAP repeat